MNTDMQAVADVLRGAGARITQAARPAVYGKEGHANFVTETDLAVQNEIGEALARLMPGVGFLAEEGEAGALTDAPTFILDPIDGTTNFMRGRRASVISLALAEGREPVRAWIFNPYDGTLFTASKGNGAFRDGARLRVSHVPPEAALIGFGTAPYYEALMPKTAAAVGALLPVFGDLRRSGSAALDLTDVASGKLEGMFEMLLQPWDYAAGSLLVTEAGGRVGRIGGGPVDYGRGCGFVCGTPAVFDRLSALLAGI